MIPLFQGFDFTSDAGVSFQRLSCVSLCGKNKRKGGVEKEGKAVKVGRSQEIGRQQIFFPKAKKITGRVCICSV